MGTLQGTMKLFSKSLSVPSEYKCQFCDITKPLNSDHFQVVKKFKFGYSTVCNECNKPKPKE